MEIRAYQYDEMQIGMTEEFIRTFTLEDENAFRKLSGDDNPLHKDDEYALSVGEGKFRQHILFGMLTASLYSTLAGMFLPGKYSLIHSIDIKFQKPVYVGDCLTVTGKVIDRQDAFQMVVVSATIKNQQGNCVSKANIKILVLKQEEQK